PRHNIWMLCRGVSGHSYATSVLTCWGLYYFIYSYLQNQLNDPIADLSTDNFTKMMILYFSRTLILRIKLFLGLFHNSRISLKPLKALKKAR
ncbi:MAG: hypothetical protein K9N06_10545, partial [Candidatus Cloacimonetes bacterium]|nr:hypothetical protein [Candidatus Cloacimonadota bacterium]